MTDTANAALPLPTKRPGAEGMIDAEGETVLPAHIVPAVLDSLSDFVCLCLDGAIRHINRPGLAILGADDMYDVIGKPFTSFLCDDFTGTIDNTLDAIADEGSAMPIRVKGLNGVLQSLAIRTTRLPELGNGAYVVVGQNLTRQVELSEAVHKSEQRFRKLVHSALDFICVLENGIITYVNQAGLTLLKAAFEDEVVGKPLSEFLHPDYQPILEGDIAALAEDGVLIPVRLRDISQNNIDGQMGITVLENGRTVRCMIEVRDITAQNRAVSALRHSIDTLEHRVQERTRELQDEVMERRRAEEMLRHVASHDGLTDLPNRSLMMDRLDKAIHHSRRESKKCAVVFIDLDGFKPVNDTLGHDMGDLLLRKVAARLQQSIRQADTASRFGGDEFVLVLTDINKPDDAAHVARKVLEDLSKPFPLGEKTAHIGASIGVALYPDHGETSEDILKQADDAMYAVKGRGKNDVAIAKSALPTA